MDTAKAIGVIHENPGVRGRPLARGRGRTPRISATFISPTPTTQAGTAAEVTINYVITDPEKVRKFVCVDTSDIPEVAVVDPDMMASMPVGSMAATGMDALTHAIEGYTTKGAWELSDMFHLEAIRIISHNLREAVAEQSPSRRAARRWRWASTLPVWPNVGLGIVHSMARTRFRRTMTPHGVACAASCPCAWSTTPTPAASATARLAA